MYVIAGATGRVGSVAAQTLLDAGHPVRVVVRRPEAAAQWEERGAEARVATFEDQAALTDALRGCAGFFAMLPFDLSVDDLDAHADRQIDAVAGAVRDAAVPHVVMLSSGGADVAEGTGPISGLHRLENALRATGTTVTALRSGHFQEKFEEVLDAARATGVYPVFAASADAPIPLSATRDLGVVVAEALQAPPAASETVDVLGPTYTEREIAAHLGAALGRDLEVVTVPEAAWVGSLREAGFPAHVAESLAEMYRGDEQGLLDPRGDRRIDIHTPLAETIERVVGRAEDGAEGAVHAR